MRTFGVDVHRRFLEVSVSEGGRTGRIGRVEMADLEAFADSLAPDDHVVIESTSVSWAVVDLLGRRAGRVTVSNPMKTKAIPSMSLPGLRPGCAARRRPRFHGGCRYRAIREMVLPVPAAQDVVARVAADDAWAAMSSSADHRDPLPRP